MDKLRRYVWLVRGEMALAIAGFLAILLGISCLPGGATNPEAHGSFFVVAQAGGWFLADARRLFVLGGALVGCSIALWGVIRVAFEGNRA